MKEIDQVSDLIGRIYDAAVDEGVWTDVIAKAVGFIGGSGAVLFSKDAASSRGNIYHDYGTDPYWVELYCDKYIALDPMGQFFADTERPVSISDMMPYGEFLQTQFYSEWAKPQGLVDFLSAILDRTATSVALFGVFRKEEHGLADSEMRRKMRIIVPHIRRTVLIGRLFDGMGSQTRLFTNLLDGVDAGIFLVESSGQIAHTNQAAQDLLAECDVVCDVGGRLSTNDAQTDNTLRQSFAASAAGDLALGVQGIAISLPSRSGGKFIGHVLPLTSGMRRREAGNGKAVAALFVRKAALEDPPPPQIIQQAYQLTPTELRVLLAIVEVGGVPEVALALGVAVTTVKTHLSRLYEKTGVNRQADLVKLVAGYRSPLRIKSPPLSR
ncbi:MAG: helix-turn-helix transcriptional regulator [Xanthobacteraceae bacterium]|nr:helix-turn-helix transcriptional regulator [Xanthobacteraceae bacterium]